MYCLLISFEKWNMFDSRNMPSSIKIDQLGKDYEFVIGDFSSFLSTSKVGFPIHFFSNTLRIKFGTREIHFENIRTRHRHSPLPHIKCVGVGTERNYVQVRSARNTSESPQRKWSERCSQLCRIRHTTTSSWSRPLPPGLVCSQCCGIRSGP